MRYKNHLLLVCHLQQNARNHIINYYDIIHNTNKLLRMSEKIDSIKAVQFGQLCPEKLGEIDNDLYIPRNSIIKDYTKYSMYNNFLIRSLEQYKIDNIILTGIQTEWCIMQTASDLINHNYTVHIPIDATGSQSKTDNDIAIDKLKQNGVIIGNTNGIMRELLDSVNSPEAKWYFNNYIKMR